jgi:hypothetical protein
MLKRMTTNMELKTINTMIGILSAFERSSKGRPSGVVGTAIAPLTANVDSEGGREFSGDVGETHNSG